MKKRLCRMSCTVLAIILLIGCGTEKERDIAIVNTSSNSEKNKMGEETKEIAEELQLVSADVFSEGLAWVAEKDQPLRCINTTGQTIFKLDDTGADPFVGNYAIIDNSYVVDKTGRIIYNWKDEGYDLFNSDALEKGFLILSKEIDTFDKSGIFYYTLDLAAQRVKEIDLSKSDCAKNRISEGEQYGVSEYLGNGYYTIAEVEWTGEWNKPWIYNSIFQLYDITKNSLVKVRNMPVEKGAIELFKSPEENIVYGCYSPLINGEQIIKIDLSALKAELKVEDVQKGIEGEAYLNNIARCRENLIGIDFYKSGVWRYYDMADDTFSTLNTEFDDKGKEVLSHKNGYFILRLKNDVNSEYIAVVDKKGKTVMEPVKFEYEMFTPQFVGNGMVYYNEGVTYFVNMQTWETQNQFEEGLSSYSEIGELDESEWQYQNGNMPDGEFGDDRDGSDIICCEDNGKGYVFIECQDEDEDGNIGYRAFTGLGEALFDGRILSLSPQFQNGFVLLHREDGCYEYWNENGEKLLIQD